MTTLEVQTYRIALGIAPGAVVRATPDGLHCEVGGWQQEIRIGDERVREAFADLAVRPATSADLLQVALSGGGDLAAAMAAQVAQGRLLAVGALRHVLLGPDDSVLATLSSAGALPVALRPVPQDGLARALSPHLVATVHGSRMVLESGATNLRVGLDADLFAALVGGRHHELPPPVFDLLHSARLWLTEAELTSREFRQWDAADLWFHRKSTEYRRGPGYGGTFRLAKEFEPLPFDRLLPPDAVVVDLPTPELGRADEPTVAQAMEQRHSVRAFRVGGVTLDHVGALLYRTMRARGTRTVEGGLELVDRLYPSGGAIHELDAYVLADDVVELPRGLYRYDSRAHRLVLVTDDARHLGALAHEATMNAGADRPAPVVMLLSARFGRLMWKYEGMAYALLTKHVGVVYEALYLAAQAEGLGVCGLGGCSSQSFVAATGVDPMAEDVVGQLVLGVPDDGEPEARRTP